MGNARDKDNQNKVHLLGFPFIRILELKLILTEPRSEDVAL